MCWLCVSGDVEQARVFAVEVIVRQACGSPSLLAALGAVWPAVLRKQQGKSTLTPSIHRGMNSFSCRFN